MIDKRRKERDWVVLERDHGGRESAEIDNGREPTSENHHGY